MKKLNIFLFLFFFSTALFAVNSITVISPNGGENWTIGCAYTIQWITATPMAVKIELYKDGNYYMTICNQVTSSQNSYPWTPPYSVIPAGTYKVKVSALSNTAVFDYSDNPFSINLGSITVTSPNGGEIWQYGTTHLILWNYNLCDNVRIELWKGGVYYSLITASTPCTGSFPWAITNSIAAGNDYKIKILSVNSNSSTSNIVYDYSDANFTIGSSSQCVNVLVPNGGELWIRGHTYTISWIDCVAEPVRIELWKAGAYYSLIAGSITGISFSWTIPNTIPSGTDYKVKVIGITNSSNYDFSDNNFFIIGPNAGTTQSTDKPLQIYPDPCSDHLSVKFLADLPGTLTFEVLKLTGGTALQELKAGAGADEVFQLNTSGLQNGGYVLLVKDTDGIIFKSLFFVRN